MYTSIHKTMKRFNKHSILFENKPNNEEILRTAKYPCITTPSDTTTPPIIFFAKRKKIAILLRVNCCNTTIKETKMLHCNPCMSIVLTIQHILLFISTTREVFIPTNETRPNDDTVRPQHFPKPVNKSTQTPILLLLVTCAHSCLNPCHIFMHKAISGWENVVIYENSFHPNIFLPPENKC